VRSITESESSIRHNMLSLHDLCLHARGSADFTVAQEKPAVHIASAMQAHRLSINGELASAVLVFQTRSEQLCNLAGDPRTSGEVSFLG
jgi:hypothetical protein